MQSQRSREPSEERIRLAPQIMPGGGSSRLKSFEFGALLFSHTVPDGRRASNGRSNGRAVAARCEPFNLPPLQAGICTSPATWGAHLAWKVEGSKAAGR